MSFYYCPHSNLQWFYDYDKEDFSFKRMYHELPVSLGYLPSYK